LSLPLLILLSRIGSLGLIARHILLIAGIHRLAHRLGSRWIALGQLLGIARYFFQCLGGTRTQIPLLLGQILELLAILRRKLIRCLAKIILARGSRISGDFLLLGQ